MRPIHLIAQVVLWAACLAGLNLAISTCAGMLLSKWVTDARNSNPDVVSRSVAHIIIRGNALPNPVEGFSGVGESHE